MNNFSVDIYGEGDEMLRTALSLFARLKCCSYQVDTKKGLILYGHNMAGKTHFPMPLSEQLMFMFVREWLATAPIGPKPDIDGDCKRGFRVYTRSSCRDDKGEYVDYIDGYVAIKPIWATYGK